MEQKKQISLRKDVVTNTMHNKKELIRIVKNKQGEIFVDQTNKANGRGVYMKPVLSNIELAKKNKSLERGLKSKIPNEIFDEIEKEIKENWN